MTNKLDLTLSMITDDGLEIGTGPARHMNMLRLGN